MSSDKEELSTLKVESLTERAKELNCLYRVDNALHNLEKSVDRAMEELLDVLPAGWRFSDICEPEIILGDQIYIRPNLHRTELKISALIKSYGQILGEVRVYYVKPVKLEKGIFLPEEVQMLNAIAAKIGSFVTLQKLKPIDSGEEIDTDEFERFVSMTGSFSGLQKWLKTYGLNMHEASELLRNPLNFRKGETIGKQGAYTSYFILLAKGATKSYIEGTASKSYSFMLTLPFEFIGLSSLFGNNYYFSTVALIPSTVFLIEKEAVIKLMLNNPKFNRCISKWLCDSYKILFHKMACLSLKQTIGRMAEVLLYLSNDVFKNDTIPHFMSRKDLAELSSMSNENAVRILSDFKSEKILKDTPEGLQILNKQLLQTISITG
jgi:CRP/FNR family transcriptional regulator